MRVCNGPLHKGRIIDDDSFYLWNGSYQFPCKECKKEVRRKNEKKKKEVVNNLSTKELEDLKKNAIENKTKKCSKCQEIKSIDFFTFNKKYVRFNSICKICRNKNEKQRKNKVKQIAESLSTKQIDQIRTSIKEKQCSRCKETKSVNSFLFKRNILSYNSWCKECESEKKKEWEERKIKERGGSTQKEIRIIKNEIASKNRTRKCEWCEKIISIENFRFYKDIKNYGSVCRNCHKAIWKRTYIINNLDEHRNRIYRQNHSDGGKLRRIRYKQKNGHTFILDNDLSQWAKEVYSKFLYTCQRCGRTNVKINAHHVLSKRKHKNLKYEVNNGICLCEKCHVEFHRVYGKFGDINNLFEFLNYDWLKKGDDKCHEL